MPNKLDPFVPSVGDPWDRLKAARLMRRAGFGMTPPELDLLVGDGSQAALIAAVDALVDYPDTDPALEAKITAFAGGALANPVPDAGIFDVQWLYRMRYANHPLQEQLTFFFHDHFATEYQKIRGLVGDAVGDDAAQEAKAADILRTQIELFRTEGIKDFRSLLLAVTRNPAMLLYLDNWQNIAGRAQENYARELMELFAMGVNNYTEDDVRAVARAVTGESLDDAANLGYLYRDDVHDRTAKTVLGTVIPASAVGFGYLDTEQVIDIILSKPATAEFMAGKLIAWFVDPDPDTDAVAELAQIMRDENYVFREVLRALFKSNYFHQEPNLFAIHKTPVDFGIYLVRQIGLTDAEMSSLGHWQYLQNAITNIGMTLLAPPNVGGWIQGPAWVNTVSLINRFNLMGVGSEPSVMTDALVDSYFPTPLTATNTNIIDMMRDRLVQVPDLRPGERTIFDAHLALIDTQPLSAIGKYRAKVRALAHLMSALPVYQMK